MFRREGRREKEINTHRNTCGVLFFLILVLFDYNPLGGNTRLVGGIRLLVQYRKKAEFANMVCACLRIGGK